MLLLAGCGNRGEAGKDIKEVPSTTEKVNTASTDWDKITDSDFDYTYDSKLQGVEVRYKGSASKVRFPDKINGDPVVAIGGVITPKSLVAVYIPISVTKIDAGAFSDCTNLTSITIPDSVTQIGTDAFASCKSLASLNIPDSVTSIHDGAATVTKNTGINFGNLLTLSQLKPTVIQSITHTLDSTCGVRGSAIS